MSYDPDYKFENFEQYYGSSDNVKKLIDECTSCKSKLVFSHLPDYKNLIIQETAQCLECGKGKRKVIHIMN